VILCGRSSSHVTRRWVRDDADMTTWDSSLAAMQERVDNEASTVDFSVRPCPQPRVNALGQSMPRERRWG